MRRVVIVGAGPAGATLALLLVQRGIGVTLVEATRTFRRSFRGEGLLPSGLDALTQMGLADVLDRIPHRPLTAWEFLINGRLLFRVAEPIEPSGPSCTLVSQPAFLEAVIAAASNYSQFELVQGSSVRDLRWQEDRVAGVVLGDDRELIADLVVGTDGRHSLVRERSRLSLVQQSQPFNILWFKLEDAQDAPDNIFYSVVHDCDTFGLFRSSEGGFQIGWALRPDDAPHWKQVNWVEKLTAASPAWLAAQIQAQATTMTGPILLTVTVGRCSHWQRPGLLLLGDAAHPMSPIRAQGINMALRDVLVATNHLVPALQSTGTSKLDAALATIQAEREPEIIRVQRLQAAEAAQAELLHRYALLRWGVNQFAPVLRYPVRWSWLKRQQQLRQGITPIPLVV